MRCKDRFTTKNDFFYALVILATFAMTGLGVLVEIVEHTGVLTGYAVEVHQASAADARSRARAIQVASAAEKK